MHLKLDGGGKCFYGCAFLLVTGVAVGFFYLGSVAIHKILGRTPSSYSIVAGILFSAFMCVVFCKWLNERKRDRHVREQMAERKATGELV